MQHQCNLIIDSCCDLPYEVVDREGVELIKFPYVMSDGEHADDLYRATSAHDFYQAMRDGEEPTTAQVPVPVFRAAFERAVESGVQRGCGGGKMAGFHARRQGHGPCCPVRGVGCAPAGGHSVR